MIQRGVLIFLTTLAYPCYGQSVDIGSLKSAPENQLVQAADHLYVRAQESPTDPANWTNVAELYAGLLQRFPQSEYVPLSTFRFNFARLKQGYPQEALEGFLSLPSDARAGLPASDKLVLAIVLNQFLDQDSRAIQAQIALIDSFEPQFEMKITNSVLIAYLRGRVLAASGAYLEAAKELHRVAQNRLNHVFAPDSIMEAGRNYEAARQYELACNYYELFYQTWPDDAQAPRVLLSLANNLYRQRGKFQQALSVYEQVVRGNHDCLSDVAALQACYCLSELQQPEDAAKKAEELLLRLTNPDMVHKAKLLAGSCWLRAGKHLDAERVLATESAVTEPSSEEESLLWKARLRSAEVAFEKEEYQIASEMFGKCAEHMDDANLRASAAYHTGLCEFRLSHFDSAINQLQNELRKGVRGQWSLKSRLLIALSQIELEKWQEALDSLQELVEESECENSIVFAVEALISAGLEFERANHLDEAISCYYTSLGQPSTLIPQVKSHEGLARCYLRMLDHRKAASHLASVLDLDTRMMPPSRLSQSTRHQYLFEMAQCYLKVHETHNASNVLNILSAAEGDSEWPPRALYERSLLHKRADNTSAMLDDLYELTTRFPDHKLAADAERILRADLKRRLKRP